MDTIARPTPINRAGSPDGYDLHAVCYSDGEQSIIDLFEVAASGRRLDSVSGVVYFGSDGEINKTPKCGTGKSLDLIPMPARHLLDLDDVLLKGRLPDPSLLMAHVLFNRGCPHQCAYCAVAQSQIRYRSGLGCREELKHLKEKHEIGGFAVVDDNFVVNKRNVMGICRSIGDLDLHWSALARVDAVDQDLMNSA